MSLVLQRVRGIAHRICEGALGASSRAILGVPRPDRPKLKMLATAQRRSNKQRTCTPDAMRLCGNVVPDIARTTACMKANFARLSPECRLAIREVLAHGTYRIAAGALLYFLDRLLSMNFCEGLNDLSVR
jgi:hypothetical protein